MVKRRDSVIATVLCFASLQAACSTTAEPVSAAAVEASAQAASVPAGAYRLGLGDKLRVVVFGEEELSGEFQVSGAGAVNMPLIGDVKAVGLTAAELQDQLVERYRAGYIRDPKIAVEVYDFRPYFILGEVERPGRFPATEGLTVLSAIATAGGFTYRANTKQIFIRRAGEAAERPYEVSANIAIQPGDVIRVGERRF
jgi:protein involved in polysaccharide export with SLBB domain